MIHFLLADAHVFILSGTWYFNSLCFPFRPLCGPGPHFHFTSAARSRGCLWCPELKLLDSGILCTAFLALLVQGRAETTLPGPVQLPCHVAYVILPGFFLRVIKASH